MATEVTRNGRHLGSRSLAEAILAAVLRELADQPEINRYQIADLADELEGVRRAG